MIERIVHAIRRWRVKRRIASGDIVAAVRLLALHGGYRDVAYQEVQRLVEHEQWEQTLFVCLALVQSDDSRGTDVVLKLVREAQTTTPWHLLDEEELEILQTGIATNGSHDDVCKWWACLDDTQLQEVRPAANDPLLHEWLRLALVRTGLWLDAVDVLYERALPGANRVVGGVDAIKLLKNQFAECCNDLVALTDQQSGNLDEALHRLHVLRIATDSPVPHELISALASRLSTLRFESLKRTADLLRSAPRLEYVDPLRKEWISRVKRFVFLDTTTNGWDSVDPESAMVGFAVLHALGACVAQNPLVASEKKNAELETELREWLEDCNKLIDYRNRALGELRVDFGADLADGRNSTTLQAKLVELKELDRDIARMQSECERIRRALAYSQSAPSLLTDVLLDAQHFHPLVRQGALAGLFELWAAARHDETMRREIGETVAWCVLGMNGTSDQQDRGDRGTEETHYQQMPDWRRFDEHFCERRVYVPTNAGRLEAAAALHDGLTWMSQLLVGDDEAFEFRFVFDVISEITAEIPRVLRFLTEYPLRLMLPPYHRLILGRFLEDRYRLEWWTTYEPPRLVGRVIRRFLQLDDLTRPNAIGICYALFRDARLVMPVIYHEFLHFGGVFGEPSQGIRNEFEVLIREMLFARRLLASRCLREPARDVAAFEHSYLESLMAARLPSISLDLLLNFHLDLNERQTFNYLAERIADLYGGDQSPEQATRKMEGEVHTHNINIEIHNRLETWDPQIEFPRLDTGESAEISHRLRKIAVDREMQSNQLSWDAYSSLLSEPASEESLAVWNDYVALPDAMSHLKAMLPLLATVSVARPYANDPQVASSLSLPWWFNAKTHESDSGT